MLKKFGFAAALLVATCCPAQAQLVKVAYTMNFATNQAIAAHYVDFSSIKPDRDPAYVWLTRVVRHAQQQDSGSIGKFVAAKTVTKYDCKYGAGGLTEYEEAYSNYDLNPKNLVYKTPKPTRGTIVMYNQWIHEDGVNPVMIGRAGATFQDIACGKLKRSDFE